MNLINKIEELYTNTLFEGKSKIIIGDVYNECATLSAKCRSALEKTLQIDNIRIVNRDGEGDHRSLWIFDEKSFGTSSDYGITLDTTISQFIPTMKGKIFLGTDIELLQTIYNNTIINPNSGKPFDINKDNIYKLLYGELRNEPRQQSPS